MPILRRGVDEMVKPTCRYEAAGRPKRGVELNRVVKQLANDPDCPCWYVSLAR